MATLTSSLSSSSYIQVLLWNLSYELICLHLVFVLFCFSDLSCARWQQFCFLSDGLGSLKQVSTPSSLKAGASQPLSAALHKCPIPGSHHVFYPGVGTKPRVSFSRGLSLLIVQGRMLLISIYCCPLGSLLIPAIQPYHGEVKLPLQQQKYSLGELWTLPEPLKSVLAQTDGRRFQNWGEVVGVHSIPFLSLEELFVILGIITIRD